MRHRRFSRSAPKAVNPKPAPPTEKEIDDEVRRLCDNGTGVLYPVHTYEGRRHSSHNVLVIHDRYVFFPHHGMATPAQLVAEIRLQHPDMVPREVLLKDACYAVALFLLKASPDCPMDFGVNRRSSDGLSPDMRLWWPSEETRTFLRRIYCRRSDRYQRDMRDKAMEPWNLPFIETVTERTRRIRDNITAAFDRRVSATLRSVSAKGIKQHDLYSYYLPKRW